MKTKVLLVIGVAFAIAVFWNVAAYVKDRSYHATYLDQTIDQWLERLATDTGAGTNALILKPVITGDEPGVVTYEMPISFDLFKKYDLLEKGGKIHLFVDGEIYSYQSYDRATNGNFLISWNTTFAPPGTHRIHAELWLCPMDRPPLVASGPILTFHSDSLSQFDSFNSSFDSNGALLYAKVAKTNLTYSIELKTPAGAHVKTITGRTVNGIIEEHWDLIDDYGNKYTNDSFVSDFHVTQPDGNTKTTTSSGTRMQQSR